MKKLFAPALLLCSTLSLANEITPANPMEYYTPSTHSDSEIQYLWNTLSDDMRDKHCYQRAQIWTYNMDRRNDVKSAKIFIHYTDRFNNELDELGHTKSASSKLKRHRGLSKRTRDMARRNKTWDYHVAPLVFNHSGESFVLDKSLPLAYDAQYPYTEDEAWNLTKRVATPEEWVEGLTVRGEILWEARKALLEVEMAELRSDIGKTRSDSRKEKLNKELREKNAKYIELGMADNDSIDIQCKKVDSIADVDKNHKTEWCYYTVAPMYYYNEIDLRNLAYGQTDLWSQYQWPVPVTYHTSANHADGRARFVQRSWNPEEIEISLRELKDRKLKEEMRDALERQFGDY